MTDQPDPQPRDLGAFSIATCSYSEYDRTMGIPVRTTVGKAKWFPYEPAVWRTVMPDYRMLGLPQHEYRKAYRHKLHKATIERVLGDAHEIHAEMSDGDWRTDQLVVLCFDALHKPGAWCHRTMFADWMAEHGVVVHELGRTRQSPPNDGGAQAGPRQAGLF